MPPPGEPMDAEDLRMMFFDPEGDDSDFGLRLLVMVLVVSVGSLVQLVRRFQAKKVISRTVTLVLMVVLKVV